MEDHFSDGHRGQPIVPYDGPTIGTVREVQIDRATVERADDSEGLTNQVKEMLEWDHVERSHELHLEHVDRSEDDKLYFQRRS